jgi:hypothetical protein
MPKAMHDKLKALAERKGLKGEHKDAFVYGTMRKTGWKPKREIDKKSKKETHTAMSRLDRLIELKAKLNNVVELDSYEDEQRRFPYGTVAAGGLGVGAIGTGLYYRGRGARAGVMGAMGAGAQAIPGDIAQHAGRSWAYAKGVGGAARELPAAFRHLKGQGRSMGGAAKATASQLWKYLKTMKYSSRQNRLIQLQAKLNRAINLEA